MGAVTVGFTGDGGGKLKEVADMILDVPASNVSVIQEGHLVCYHRIVAMVVKNIFGYDALV